MKKAIIIFFFFITLLCFQNFTITSTNRLHVDDYGAIPNDGNDDGPAIQAAINQAIRNPNIREIVFSSGNYSILPQFNDFHLRVKNAKNLTLVGAKDSDAEPLTKLIFTDVTKGGIDLSNNLKVSGSTNGRSIELNGFVLDYSKLPYATATINSVSGNIISVTQTGGLPLSHSAFLVANQPFAFVGWHNSVNTKYVNSVAKFLPKTNWIKNLGNNKFELTADEIQAKTYIAKDNPLIILARNYTAPMIRLKDNIGGVIVKNVTVRGSPGAASEWGRNSGWRHAINFKVVLANTNRTISTNADGIHAYGNRGPMLIKDCYFDGISDDAINLHNRGIDFAQTFVHSGPIKNMAKLINSSTIEVRNVGTNDYEAQDMLTFVNAHNGSLVTRAKVSSSSFNQTTYYYTIRLSKPLPQHARTNFSSLIMFNNSANSGNAVIENNYFGTLRGRGIVLGTENVQVKNNVADHLLGPFVMIHASMLWKEGAFPKNIVITQNIAHSASKAIKPRYIPLIISSIENADGSHSTAEEIADIRIYDNNFYNSWGPVQLLVNTKTP